MSWTVDERPGLALVPANDVGERRRFSSLAPFTLGGIYVGNAGQPMLDLARRLELNLARLFGLIPQLGRYTVVSGAALLLDFALFLSLIRLGVAPTLAGVAGYAVGLALHYGLSARFVFDAARAGKPHARLFSEFALTGLAGLVITAAVISVATGVAGLAPVLAKALAAILSFVAVYLMRRQIVFAPIA